MLTSPVGDLEREEPTLADFRARLRAVVSRWADDEVGTWERRGFLPRHVFRDLAASGVWRQRWACGREGGVRHAAVLIDECSRVSMSLGLGVSVHAEVFCGVLHDIGGPSAEAVLEDALAGEALGCVASTEPTGGSDIANVRTIAVGRGDRWLLQGAKRYITNAGIATHAVVLAQAKGESVDRPGPTLFLVPLDRPGVHRAGSFRTMGMRGCDTSALELDVELEDELRLGPPGVGIHLLSRALQMERLLAAQQMITLSRSALRFTAGYLRRRPLGDGRLVDKQALRHRLADAMTQLLACECLYSFVLSRYEQAQPVERELAALKLHAATMANHLLDECVQFLGGRAYTENFPLERWWRDARIVRIGGGTDEVMREVVARHLDRPDPEIDELLAVVMAADLPQPLETSEIRKEDDYDR